MADGPLVRAEQPAFEKRDHQMCPEVSAVAIAARKSSVTIGGFSACGSRISDSLGGRPQRFGPSPREL